MLREGDFSTEKRRARLQTAPTGMGEYLMVLKWHLEKMSESEPFATPEFEQGLRYVCDSARLIFDDNGAAVHSIRSTAERLRAEGDDVREFVDRLRTEKIPIFSAVWVDRNRFFLSEKGQDLPAELHFDRCAPCLKSEMRYLDFHKRDALRAQAFADFRERIEPLISVRGWNAFTIDDLSLAWDADRGDVRSALSLVGEGLFEDLSLLCLPGPTYVIERAVRGPS